MLTLVPEGLTLRIGLTLREEVHASECLQGLDLVEVNPSLAKNELVLNQTIKAICLSVFLSVCLSLFLSINLSTKHVHVDSSSRRYDSSRRPDFA
jgi:hypothetical protein